MLDWLLAQAIKLAISVIIKYLTSKGFTDAAQALGDKAAHEIIAEVKALPEYPSADTKNRPFG